MAQIVQGSSLAERLGTGLGAGLGQGIQQLAQNKLSSMQLQNQQRQLANAYSAVGLPQQLAYLPQEIQGLYVKDLLAAPGEQAYAQALQGLLGGGQEEQSLQGALGGLQQQEQLPQGAVEALQRFSPQGKAFPQVAGFEQQPQAVPQQAAAPMQQQAVQQVQPKIPSRLKPAQATKLAELGLKQQEIGRKEQAERFKITKDERKEILDRAKAARQTIKDLDRMQELQDSGKLDTPGYAAFLERAGLNIPALMNPESEEFNKIAVNFLRDAKNYFGARVTQQEVQLFLQGIPSLSQSPEGRKRVIANLKYIANGALEYNNALKEVIQENKGVPPYDLMERIDDKVEKKLDSLAARFKKDLSKPVPKGQNKLITALQAGLGSVIGGAGPAAEGAAKGAGFALASKVLPVLV